MEESEATTTAIVYVLCVVVIVSHAICYDTEFRVFAIFIQSNLKTPQGWVEVKK